MKINGKTSIYGLIGHPIKHTFSPPMHNIAFEELNYNGIYLPFHVTPENLSIFLKGLKYTNVAGLNVTIPHKQAVLKNADFLSPEVKVIRAANVLKFIKGKIYAYNTDGSGFIKSLSAFPNLKTLRNKNILILGAGGSTRSILYSLIKEKVKSILIMNRTESKARKLVNEFKKLKSNLMASGIEYNILKEKAFDLIINTTSAGMNKGDNELINTVYISPKTYVADIIYNPIETTFLKKAKKNGAYTINGLGMLLYQASEAFKIWTGIVPPEKKMLKALKAALK